MTKRLCVEIFIAVIPITLVEQISTMQNDTGDVSGRRWSRVARLRGM